MQGPKYSGCCYQGQLSTVSILRAGEVLEPAISAVCKVIRMGKILIQTNEYSGEPEVSGECRLPLTIKPPPPASPLSPIAPPCLLSISFSLPPSVTLSSAATRRCLLPCAASGCYCCHGRCGSDGHQSTVGGSVCSGRGTHSRHVLNCSTLNLPRESSLKLPWIHSGLLVCVFLSLSLVCV